MSEEDSKPDLKLGTNIVTLPQYIDFESYTKTMTALVEALAEHETNPVYLLCNGDGGEVIYGLTLCELVSRCPRIVGVLTGYAGSANSGIWAACPTRLYGDYGHLLIHGVQNSNAGGAASDLRLDLSITDYQTLAIATLYARASNKDVEFWLAQLDHARQSAVLLTAEDLAKYQFGEHLNIDIFAKAPEPVLSLKIGVPNTPAGKEAPDKKAPSKSKARGKSRPSEHGVTDNA